MTDAIILSIISTGGTVAVAYFTYRTATKITKVETKVDDNTKLTHEVNEKVDVVKTQTDGIKTELVDTAGKLGEAIGKAIGRKEVMAENKEQNYREASVIILDDDRDDMELMARTLKDNGIENYSTFSGEDEFIKALTSEVNVYIIDHFLTKGTGLSILYEIRKKNENNFVIICTGSENQTTIKDYVNAGADKVVFKNDKDYLRQLDNFVKEGLRVLVMRK